MPVTTGSAVGSARTSLATNASVRSGEAVPDAVSSRFSFRRAGYAGVADFLRPVTWSVIQADDGELWMLSSGYPISPGSTVYIGGFVDSVKEDAQTPIPARVVKGIWFGAKTPPGDGESYRYTLFKNGEPTACTFTLTGSQRKGKSTVEVAFADQDEMCVEVEVSGGAPEVVHNGSVDSRSA